MFISFLYELRSRKVPVGTHEAVALAEALGKGLHSSSLDGFYDIARALLVHSEAHLDAFDQAFAKHFKGIESSALEIHQELLEWLKQAKQRVRLTPEEEALLDQLDAEELERLLQERLREQKERHDGGSKWVGTGGRSPFGHSGAARDGIRVGGPGGNRRAIRVATERHFQEYRDDVVLDVRQLGLALRKLRAFSRDGVADEVDIDETISKTAKNLGELDVAVRPPRKSSTRVILAMDVGGSMDPHSALVSRLFTAAKKATHFKELRTYYFHNCIYGRLYRSAQFTEMISVHDLLAECGSNYKLLIVGDALMAPWELMSRSAWPTDNTEGLGWLMQLREHFHHSAWLNPEPPSTWYQQTIDVIRKVFPMFPLTLEGLGESVQHLMKGGR